MAKKDWELTHLQTLRAEEERLAEEDAVDVLLTYDRPETANKVILRRRPSTGTWEILSPPLNNLVPGGTNEGSMFGRETEKPYMKRFSSRERPCRRGRVSNKVRHGTPSLSSPSVIVDPPVVQSRVDNINEHGSPTQLNEVGVNEQESPLRLLLNNHYDDSAECEVGDSDITMRKTKKNGTRDDDEGERRVAEECDESTTEQSEDTTKSLVTVKSEDDHPSPPQQSPQSSQLVVTPPKRYSTRLAQNHSPSNSQTQRQTSLSSYDGSPQQRHKYPTRHKLQNNTSFS